ncbi:hypothetical protein BGZ95_005820 [Linnemannia exigua]|uniref:Uncharacterized protein n=1 Tax=Linnemannia exigua TaxID=604196 RepID=A0AAD4D3K6_9FUNG|nr:hypothetical protein BGZ95_005820 [Linnemannia exigua]
MALINTKGTKVLHTIVDGDTIDDAFFTDYSTARTVEDLRGVIAKTMSGLDSFQNSGLHDIDEKRLQLWKVIIPPGPAVISLEDFTKEVIHLDNVDMVKVKL